MSGCFGKLQVVNMWASHMDESLVICLKFINELFFEVSVLME